MFEFKTLLVEKNIKCPNCDHELSIGDTMYRDDYRDEVICGYCKEEYIDDVISEEGEDGRLLK